MTRDLREFLITDEDAGLLFIDDSLKEEGFVYRIVDSEKPGWVNRLTRMGYEIVYKAGAKIGSQTAFNPSNLSDMVQVELGTNHHRQGILMRIPQEIYDAREKHKHQQNVAAEKALGKTGIPTQFGEITLGNEKL